MIGCAQYMIDSDAVIGQREQSSAIEDWHPAKGCLALDTDLATLTRNTLVTALDSQHTLTLTARPTPLQQKAQDLLGLARTQ
jgi:hypothetical protein